MGPRSSDACCSPKHVLLFILIWNHTKSLRYPQVPPQAAALVRTSQNDLEQFDLCRLRFGCAFDDHGAVTAVIEQGVLVFTFFVSGGVNTASVSGGCYVAFTVRAECHVALVLRW